MCCSEWRALDDCSATTFTTTSSSSFNSSTASDATSFLGTTSSITITRFGAVDTCFDTTVNCFKQLREQSRTWNERLILNELFRNYDK